LDAALGREKSAAAAEQDLANGVGERVYEDAEVVKLPNEVLHAIRHAAVRVGHGACQALEGVARKKHAHDPERAALQRILGHKPRP
jgi:hypothetical protein